MDLSFNKVLSRLKMKKIDKDIYLEKKKNNSFTSIVILLPVLLTSPLRILIKKLRKKYLI